MAKVADELGVATGQITVPVIPSPETGDFTNTLKTHVDQIDTPEDVDPISEADLFLNFGRDVQAEEILKEALQNTPNNHLLHLKLLGIYANRKDVNAFAAVARQLQALGNAEANQQAAVMGRRIDPNNPMYGGSASIEDADSATMQTAALNAIPDFDVNAAPAAQTVAPEVDFDLGSPAQNFSENAKKTMVLTAEDMAASQVGTMDFDVTVTNPSLTAAPAMDFDISVASDSPALNATGDETDELPNLDDLIFDVTSTNPSLHAAQPQASQPVPEKPASDLGMMDFDLDFPVNEPVAKPVNPSAEIDFAGIDLDMAETASNNAPASETVQDEHWHEVATKLDLAKAYQEMGDNTGAKEILDEVVQEGDAEQRQAAQAMLSQLA